MPIKPQHRFLYPLDWPQISVAIRFGRAKGCCERCGRRHKTTVRQLPDGRWFDETAGTWRDDHGRPAREPELVEAKFIETRRVILATCHVNHNRSDCRWKNLFSGCGRCHLSHDRREHLRLRRITYLQRRALGDLFSGPYPAI